ncbi:MAG: hypothetical protein L6Q54_12340 [Leptospiraceae bacterium]|nr:hypothetical protein [Leptospiraceae bacterium]MCK6382021.1 hypothetical protein [Leptospiraceae bacterium]NUM42346.1 hypothetical protein [Leptospiraceae bacterium]
MNFKKTSNRLFFRLAIVFALSIVIANCEKRDSNDRETKSTLLSLALSGGSPNVTNACRWAVYVLNSCIADGYGFNYATMCNKEITKYFTESDYHSLSDCATSFRAATSCHLNQNKFPNAQSAFSNTSFVTAGVSGTTSFNSCNKTATTTNDQTMNIMVY